MKTGLLSILLFCIFSSLSAQREIDLRVNLLSPVGGTEIHPMEPYDMSIEITNMGTEPLLTSDSLAIYLLMNGDTIPVMPGNYWIHTNVGLASQQTQIISKMLAFDNSALGAHIDLCLFVRPYNAVDPVMDPALANNKSCAEIDVVEAVSSTEEMSQEMTIIYPNPVKGTLFVSGENMTSVSIVDQTGKTVLQNLSDLSQIDCSALKSGVYFVRIATEKGLITQKIVKE